MSTNDNNNLHLFRNNKNYAQIYDTDVHAVVEITATATTITTFCRWRRQGKLRVKYSGR